MPADLQSWNDTPTKAAITAFVARVTSGPDAVPAEERIAVFDNDGTLWTEKPMPVELVFILKRWGEMAEADPSLRDRQPWKAAVERDYAFLAGAIDKHYAGDDSDVKVLMGGVIGAFAGMEVEAYGAAAAAFVRERPSSDPETAVPKRRLPADGRAAALPRGERVHDVHRVGR